jgi:bifunctional non-homologous end joining protein LigD
MALETYRAKRNFERTPEPPDAPGEAASRLRYVIQRHAARRLHYDFRLELDGVLKSWAVPKGPSPDPADKRLAVHVEDHPLAYGDFEGTIPPGEYGAGTVQLWDQGWWEPVGDPRAGYRRGKLEFVLHGQRLKGHWALVRMHGRAGDNADNWLLIKERDDAGGDAPAEADRSVASGRGMDEIAAQAKPRRRAAPLFSAPSTASPAVPADPPADLRPMLATLVKTVPEGDDWLHEIKLDGYRLLAHVRADGVRLYTRSGQDWTARLRGVADAIAGAALPPCVLDGELVVFDAAGISRFQLLQQALGDGDASALHYVAFDLPWCAGEDLRDRPLHARKARLARLLAGVKTPVLRYGDHVQGQGAEFFAQACRHGLEGIIAKRADSSYRAARTRSWLKLKCGARQEVVIGGYTDPQGSRAGFGSLLVGHYDADGSLVYAGRVGTGFDDALLRTLHRRLEKLARPDSPFAHLPAAARRGAHFVAPELVCEVAFTEWTEDGHLRHPSFLGLREDKDPRLVSREQPADAPPADTPAAAPPRPRTAKRKTARAAPATPATPRRSTARDAQAGSVRVAGVTITHPDRVLFPEQGLTKQALAEFYVTVAPLALPHVADRPLSLLRCPEGRARACFFQKHLGPGAPDAIGAVEVPEQDGTELYPLVRDAAGMVGLLQLGVLEVHPWGSRADRLERPDRLILDLDPAPDVAFDRVKDAARVMREVLADLGLESFVKTTGGKGLHVVAPLDRRADWDTLKGFSRAIAHLLERSAPKDYVATASKAKRGGRIFVDWLRNGRGATAVAPYVTRARPGAPVATPLAWEELDTLTSGAAWTVVNFPERLAQVHRADPWAGFFERRQTLTAAALRKVGAAG